MGAGRLQIGIHVSMKSAGVSIHTFVEEKEYHAAMTSKIIAGITISASPQDRETAVWIEETCERALRLAQEMWALDPPQDCHIYVMTSWWKFFFRSAPWPWKVLLAIGFPLWALRARRTWPYAAAWTQRFGRRVVIGVKPPRILEQSDLRVGVRMFVEEKDMRLKLQHVSCHELIHACSAHLRLPMWLNEGLATVTVDYYLGKTTILKETLELLRDYQPKAPPPTYRQLSRMKTEALVYHTTRGYWLTRYLSEQHNDFMIRLLETRRSAQEIDKLVVERIKIDPLTFWQEIDGILVRYFTSATTPA